MANNVDSDDYQFGAASPIMSSGIDVDKLLSADPQTLDQARALGFGMFQGGPTPPQANSGTPTESAAPVMVPGQDKSDSAKMAPAWPAPASPTAAGLPKSALDGLGGNLAASHNPPSMGPASVPAAVTSSGDADTMAQGVDRAGRLGESFAQRLAGEPTLEQKLAPIQAQRTLPPQQADPNHPEYRPTAGRRILRGIVGGLEGLARGGIRGSLLGAVDPEAVGATPYGGPTRAFSIAAQKQAAQQAALDQQEKQTTDAFKEDTGRARDVINSFNDSGKNYAAGETAQSREETAQTREEEAGIKQQLADIRQQVADFQTQGKAPTTYEATVAAAALEKDPARKAALDAAAKEMAATEIKKFQYAARAQSSGGRGASAPNAALRQPMIDAATAEVQAIQDRYAYDPRRNQYVNKSNPNDILDPSEFTDKKNEVSTKLDKDLETRKLPPLGVRFNPADAGANKPSGRAARVAQNNPQPKAQPKAGDRVTVDGKAAIFVGMNPKTGKPIVRMQP